MKNSKEIKVIVVDDSALIRALLTDMLNADPRIRVVASACDAYEARELIKKHNPDVITLDIEMPKMNGIAFLKNLMRLRPMAVVMISTLTQEGAPATLEALEIGAVDFIGKPKGDGVSGIERYSETVIEKVVAASKAHVRARADGDLKSIANNKNKLSGFVKGKRLKRDFICAIGASTGGTEAIKDVLMELPSNSPPIVVAQHIPETFSASFARRLDGLCAVNVFEATHNQVIEPGGVYIAPGHSHLRIATYAGKYVCKLDKEPPINRHRPAVDPLFDSVWEIAGTKAMGVILTGMGADGAQGLLRMRQAGCLTIAQNEASSVVWGMPGAAVNLDAADKILDLRDIAKAILLEAFQ